MEDRSTTQDPVGDEERLAQEAVDRNQAARNDTSAIRSGIGQAASEAMPTPIQEKNYDTSAELAAAMAAANENSVNALLYRAFDQAIVGNVKGGGGEASTDNMTYNNLATGANAPVNDLKKVWEERAAENKITRQRRELELKDPTSEVNRRFQEKAKPWLEKLGAGHLASTFTIDDLQHKDGIYAGVEQVIQRAREGETMLLYNAKSADLKREYNKADAQKKADLAWQLQQMKRGRKGGGGGIGGGGGAASLANRDEFIRLAEADGVELSDLNKHLIRTVPKDEFIALTKQLGYKDIGAKIEAAGADPESDLGVSPDRKRGVEIVTDLRKEIITPYTDYYISTNRARNQLAASSEQELQVVLAVLKGTQGDSSGGVAGTFLANKLAAAVSEAGWDPNSGQAVRAQQLLSSLASTLALYTRAISGAQSSDKEKAFLAFAESITPGTTKATLQAKLKDGSVAIQNKVRSAINQIADKPELAKQLVAYTPFEGLYKDVAKDGGSSPATQSNKVSVMRNGTRGTIDKDKLEAFKKKYAKELKDNPDSFKVY